jgi:hypothetical protein
MLKVREPAALDRIETIMAERVGGTVFSRWIRH